MIISNAEIAHLWRLNNIPVFFKIYLIQSFLVFKLYFTIKVGARFCQQLEVIAEELTWLWCFIIARISFESMTKTRLNCNTPE